MKSIKPGRGPSAMNAMGSAFSVIFGIIWTFGAIQIGAPFFFPLFGLCFVGMGVVHTIYHYKNATQKNRYSTFDITDHGEEIDPLQARFGGGEQYTRPSYSANPAEDAETNYCPYCGAAADDSYAFCRQCGKRLPE
ncbi:MAG: zinc ribbon domain-containing protein [Clostridia bacterium]|nr:zinc ribbon domain-containing protein [Clostridia bacterium]MBQ3077650.1 zinc ribbon domain-containing protein [Clostridia bacterium]